MQGVQKVGAGDAVRAVCAALRSVCVADDNRPLDVIDGRVPGGRHAEICAANACCRHVVEHSYAKLTA